VIVAATSFEDGVAESGDASTRAARPTVMSVSVLIPC